MQILFKNGKTIDVEIKDFKPLEISQSVIMQEKDAKPLVETFNLKIYTKSGNEFEEDKHIRSIELDHYPTENEIKYWLIKSNNIEFNFYGYYAIVEKHYRFKQYYGD